VFSAVGGCKRIVAPDGSEVVPATKPQPNGTLVKALARAHRWQEGPFDTLAELADAERISRSYVCRVLRRTLRPRIVERVLDEPRTAGVAALLKPFLIEWEGQRERFLCDG
jgi:hypothetical protein